MDLYRFYRLDRSDHITAGYSVECSSDAAALRAARTLLQRAAGVEVWKNDNCVGHLSAEARHLWGQLREDWMGPASWRSCAAAQPADGSMTGLPAWVPRQASGGREAGRGHRHAGG